MDNLESARLDAMEKSLEENQEQHLQWVSNIAATLVRMDRRIELMEDLLQEMWNERRQNGSASQK